MADAAGLTRVVLPERNRRDFDEVPLGARNKLEFIWLERVDDTIAAVLERVAARSRDAEDRSSLLDRLRRRAQASRRENWIPISLTNWCDRRIFNLANFTCSGHRMRSNFKPVVGDMRKRMTRRCVSAATGACR